MNSEKSLDLNKSEQYNLSIRLSTDGFSFSIHTSSDNEEVLFKNYPVNTQRSMAANVKAFLNDTEIVKHPFAHVYILIHSQRYTPVPLEIYEDEQTEMLFYQNLPKVNNEIILCNILGNSNTVVLFSVDKLTHIYLTDFFPEAHFFAAVSPQIEHLTLMSRHKKTNAIYANLHPDSMDVFCFEQKKLHLINSFTANGVNDRCYYILNIWQQLKYNQETDELHLIGNRDTIVEIQKVLADYIRKISIINHQAECNRSEPSDLKDIPFDMQSLFSCV